MSTHAQLQSENETLHTDLQALTATISSQGARIAELEDFVKLVDMGGYKNYIDIRIAAKHIMEAQS